MTDAFDLREETLTSEFYSLEDHPSIRPFRRVPTEPKKTREIEKSASAGKMDADGEGEAVTTLREKI